MAFNDVLHAVGLGRPVENAHEPDIGRSLDVTDTSFDERPVDVVVLVVVDDKGLERNVKLVKNRVDVVRRDRAVPGVVEVDR